MSGTAMKEELEQTLKALQRRRKIVHRELVVLDELLDEVEGLIRKPYLNLKLTFRARVLTHQASVETRRAVR